MKNYSGFLFEKVSNISLVKDWVLKNYPQAVEKELSDTRFDFSLSLRKIITFEVLSGLNGFELYVFVEEPGGFQKMVYSGRHMSTLNDIIYMIKIEADYFLKQYS